MDLNMNAAVAFGMLLQKNPRAAAFYDHCTMEQRNAILLQVGQMANQSQLRAFVDNLPSASV